MENAWSIYQDSLKWETIFNLFVFYHFLAISIDPEPFMKLKK